MKSKYFFLSAMLIALPTTMSAQQNIQKAFDALLNEKISETESRHVLDCDSETGRKTAQADVYDFTLSSNSALERLNDVRKAFDKDKKNAYSVNSGIREEGEDAEKGSFSSLFESMGIAPVSLSVGDGKYLPVSIGSMKRGNYIYACFADKDDPDNRYRYAYAMEWAKKDKQTKVRLAVTYALRPEARTKKSKSRVIINGKDINIDDNIISLGSGFPFDNSSVFGVDSVHEKSPESWLSEFNNYKRLFLKNPDSATSTHYVTSIYKLCKESDMLDPDEKKIVAQEIAKLKTRTNDEFIKNLFDMSIKRLGK